MGSTCVEHYDNQNYSLIMVSLDKTYEINELKIRIQSTCLMTHDERTFNFKYKKVFSFECAHGAIAVRAFERALDDPSHIWRDCSNNIKSW